MFTFCGVATVELGYSTWVEISLKLFAFDMKAVADAGGRGGGGGGGRGGRNETVPSFVLVEL
jgi:hypothetical protein